MEKNHPVFTLILLSLVTTLGVVSFALCLASEFKKTKRKDLRLDETLCYLPGSPAFRFGIWALICLVVAQTIGNLIICRSFCSISREKRTMRMARKPAIATTFLFISWISFGFALILVCAATSMNRRQPYGKGWLDGDCYIVKDGVFVGAAILVSVTLGSTVASAILTTRKTINVEQEGQKVRAQV